MGPVTLSAVQLTTSVPILSILPEISSFCSLPTHCLLLLYLSVLTSSSRPTDCR